MWPVIIESVKCLRVCPRARVRARVCEHVRACARVRNIIRDFSDVISFVIQAYKQ